MRSARPVVILRLFSKTLVALSIVGTGPWPVTPSAGWVVAQHGAPVTVGSRIAGTFSDATGHSAQSHLVYAANSGVWWLFTLTSTGRLARQIESHHQVVPILRAPISPRRRGRKDRQSRRVGRLARLCAQCVHGNGPRIGRGISEQQPRRCHPRRVDMANNGPDGITGHIRAVVTGTSVSWESWNYYVAETASVWAVPKMSALGVSSGKYIHSAGPNPSAGDRRERAPIQHARYRQHMDERLLRRLGDRQQHDPPESTRSRSPRSRTMSWWPCTTTAAANRAVTTACRLEAHRNPNSTTWATSVPTRTDPGPVSRLAVKAPGTEVCSPSKAIIHQNDWAVVPVTTSVIHAFRAKANGSGVDGATYNVAANTWSAIAVPPPAFGAGQAFKAGAGLFGATDGANVWLFFVNTGAANAIVYSRYDGTSWSAWAAVPGTDSGHMFRNHLAGYPRAGSNQIGLIWMEGAVSLRRGHDVPQDDPAADGDAAQTADQRANRPVSVRSIIALPGAPGTRQVERTARESREAHGALEEEQLGSQAVPRFPVHQRLERGSRLPVTVQISDLLLPRRRHDRRLLQHVLRALHFEILEQQTRDDDGDDGAARPRQGD